MKILYEYSKYCVYGNFRSQENENTIMFAEGLKVPIDLAQRMGWGKELISATIEFGQRLKGLQIDRTEFSVLNGIVLTYPGKISYLLTVNVEMFARGNFFAFSPILYR